MEEKIKAQAKIQVECSIQFVLTKTEALALDALAGYGIDPFLKTFYEKMGRHYLEPHEKGLRDLFERIRTELPSQVNKITAVEKSIKDALITLK